MRAEGIPPANMALVLRTTNAFLVPAGQSIHGNIVESGGALYVSAAGVKVPLPPEAALQPGQQVIIESAGPGQGVVVRVLAQSTPAPSSGTPVSGLWTAVLAALRAVNAPDFPVDILPAAVLSSGTAVQAAVAALSDAGGMGADLQRLAQAVQEAVAARALPASAADGLLSLLGGSDVRQLHETIERLVRGLAERSAEARLAGAAATGLPEGLEKLDAGLRTQLLRLLAEPDFQKFLGQTGQRHAVEEAVGRLMNRITGLQLQNLHGLQGPYAFIEVPFPPDAGVRRAAIHFLSGRDRGKRGAAAAASVALDLSTTRLGDLWIMLLASEGACSCRFLAKTPEARDALSAAADDLEKSLRAAGYRDVRIETRLWEDNRFSEAAAFVRRIKGIDVQA